MKNYKILVVDDQKDNLISIVDMIEEKDDSFEVFQANSGEIACKIAEKYLPDLIIMDWEMPIMSGIETTRKIKSKELTKDIPIIICTGIMTSPAHLETAFDAGAVDFIRKPIDKIELHSRMQSMLLLSDSFKEVKSLNNYKNKLLSLIAHDLKNPIYTIKLLLDVILQENLTENRKQEILESVSTSAGQTYSLLENLLSWANAQRNKVNYDPETFFISEIVEENICLVKLNAESKSITINSTIEQNVSVYADKNMVSTVIRNLISNALKFTLNSGEINISANVKKENIHISIQDSGVGISKKNLKKILNDKTQLTTVGTMKEIGSGIGLQLCRDFVEKNNGEISVESEEGVGSTFSFSIPKEKKPDESL